MKKSKFGIKEPDKSLIEYQNKVSASPDDFESANKVGQFISQIPEKVGTAIVGEDSENVAIRTAQKIVKDYVNLAGMPAHLVGGTLSLPKEIENDLDMITKASREGNPEAMLTPEMKMATIRTALNVAGMVSGGTALIEKSPALLAFSKNLGESGAIGYHGSPYEFEKFDMGKVESGTGQINEGHGLYFTERKSGGEGYKNLYGGVGNLYKVDIPDEAVNKMLVLDKTLSEQPESIKKILTPDVIQKLRDRFPGSKNKSDATILNDLTGQDLYKMFSQPSRSVEPNSKVASEILLENDVPGLKYKSWEKEVGDQGAINFVVFDDKIPKILERNGTVLGGPTKAKSHDNFMKNYYKNRK